MLTLSLPAQSGRCRARIGPIESCVISSVARQHFEHDRTIALPVVARGGSHGPITAMLSRMFFSSRDILSRDSSLKHRQCSQGLVERYFVAGFVDSHEAIQLALPDLSMNNSVGSANVDKACLFVPWGVDLLGDNLSPEPVAVEVTRQFSSQRDSLQLRRGVVFLRIPKIHRDLHSGF